MAVGTAHVTAVTVEQKLLFLALNITFGFACAL